MSKDINSSIFLEIIEELILKLVEYNFYGKIEF